MKYRFVPDITNITVGELALVLSQFGFIVSEENLKIFTPIMMRHFEAQKPEEKEENANEVKKGKRKKAPKLAT